jgi:GNAT superfamily N-acetyltransferase
MVPITPATLEEVLALDAPQIDRDTAIRRLQRGDTGVAARVGDRIVSSVWIGARSWQLRDLGLAIHMEADQGLLYDAYTAPDMRRHGIMALLVRACVEQAKAHGHRWLFARAVASNANTMSTLGRAGFKLILRIHGLMLANAVGFYRVEGDGEVLPAAETLLSHIASLRPGLMVWSSGGGRGFRVLVPRVIPNRSRRSA